ncbi:MAG: hypothetical protein OER80_02640 [Gammaproteobacteria bacterium]|nr:hypothetical protein [Gammaproteobacteria bacterium]
MADQSFFKELRKRKVFQTAAIYGAVAWGLTEVIVTIVEQLFLPTWVSTLAVIVFVVGFPVTMFLAWTFDITSEGIQRTTISSRRGKASIAASLLLLIAGTAGLFFLIKPAIQQANNVTVAATVIPNSVAVLPFENVSRLADDLYLSEGLSDELRDQLGRVTGLQIAARSSSVAIRNQAIGATTMSATLGVEYLVEGSLRRRGNRLSISVQVIDGATGLAVWADNYERGPLEMLIVQQDIARAVLNVVYPEKVSTTLPAPTTNDASAHEFMLLARHYEYQVRENPVVDFELQLKAINFYRQAVEADPDSALGHSRLAAALMYAGDFAGAEEPIARAMAINPELSDVQTTLGNFLHFTLGIDAAYSALARGAELGPNNVDALSSYAAIAWTHEGAEVAESLFRRAISLDRVSLSRYADLGNFFGKNGYREDTLEVVDTIAATFDTVRSYHVITRLLELTGDVDEAIAWALRARDREPNNPETRSILTELYAAIGDFDTATALANDIHIGLLFQMRRYDEVIDEGGILLLDEPNDVLLRYLLAFAFNVTGQFENALRMLDSTGLSGDLGETKRFADVEALLYLVDSLNGIGETDAADQIAQQIAGNLTANLDWWTDVHLACALAVLNRDNEALKHLEKTRSSPRLPWESMLRDAPCFSRYQENPDYLALLEFFETRKTQLRERLPATLAKHRVSL